MSKKNYGINYNHYLDIFNSDEPIEEENDDPDYNVIVDILTNNYNNLEEPFYLSIPKKEVNDVMNDVMNDSYWYI